MHMIQQPTLSVNGSFGSSVHDTDPSCSMYMYTFCINTPTRMLGKPFLVLSFQNPQANKVALYQKD